MTTFITMSLAAVGAALAAFAGNRALYALLGRSAAWLAVPWWEEACKFLAAAMLIGRPIAGVALLFGMAELLYDLLRSRTDGLYLGLLSLSTHGLAGGVATLLLAGPGTWGHAFVAAGVVHMAVNLLVVRLVLPALGATVAR